MKRFLLFAGQYYYPGGGMEDFIASRDTLEEIDSLFCEKNDESYEYDWCEVIDTKTGKHIDYINGRCTSRGCRTSLKVSNYDRDLNA